MYDIIIISFMALISFVISPAAVFFQITTPIAAIISFNWLNQNVWALTRVPKMKLKLAKGL